MDSPHKGSVMHSIDVLFCDSLNKQWNKQWSYWWFKMPWDITVMILEVHIVKLAHIPLFHDLTRWKWWVVSWNIYFVTTCTISEILYHSLLHYTSVKLLIRHQPALDEKLWEPHGVTVLTWYSLSCLKSTHAFRVSSSFSLVNNLPFLFQFESLGPSFACLCMSGSKVFMARLRG